MATDKREYSRLLQQPNSEELRSMGTDEAVASYGGSILETQVALNLDRTHTLAAGCRENIDDIITAGNGTAIDPDVNAWVFPEGQGEDDGSTNVRKVVVSSTDPVWVAVYGVQDYLGYVEGTVAVPAWVDAASFEIQAYKEFGRTNWDNGTNGLVMRYVSYWESGSGTVTLVAAQDIKAVVVSPFQGLSATRVNVAGFVR